MIRIKTSTLTTMALLCLAVALSAGDALAQQKQKVSYKVTAEGSKYTQQLNVDIGDAPNHIVRIFEIRRSFPNNAPVINGAKLVEQWTRGITDQTDSNGGATSYIVSIFDNGDKFFGRTTTVSQNIGPGKFATTGAGPITGGTGKFAGIQGIIRTMGTAEPKTGFSETQTEIEYWFAK